MSYRSILAVADESPAGERAVRAALGIAAAAGGHVGALRFVDDPWPFIEPGDVEAKRALRGGAWQRVAADRVGDALRTLGPVTPLVYFDPPAVEIPRAAESVAADLLVFGSAPPGLLDDVMLRARVPCLLVPAEWGNWRRVVVAGDTFREGFAFAALFQSDVVVVDHEPELATAAADQAETTARKAFAEWARLPGTGAFDLLARDGDPVGRALEAARTERADVLVLPYARGAGAAAAIDATRRAPCAVLLVPV